MQENYLAKWLNNELTEVELKEFKKSDEYATYIKIKNTSAQLEAPGFNMEDAWESLKEKTQAQPKIVTMKPFKGFLRIAAAVAILLIGSYFYLNTLNQSISTQFAERKTVVLPDNSEIVLNAASQITYDDKNWDKKRNIRLNGEAFFKVAKGKKFTVSTVHGTVSVLGTQFNVENRDGFFEVTCYEGLVSVTYNDKEIKIPAGNSIIVINGSMSKAEVTVNGQPSWMENESSFKSIPLKYVLDEFQRQHNIKVAHENINLNQAFTGSFSNTDTDLALKSISVPLQLKFKLEGDKVLFYE